jgi:hypothetical protein
MIHVNYQHANEDCAEEPGAFTWQIATNTLQGDGAVARLYGIDEALVVAGLPLQTYIERVHTEDRGALAKAIHDAIITGKPYSARFRIVTENMAIVSVAACGRCFRNIAGEPSVFTGIVFPTEDAASPGTTLLSHVTAAFGLAVEEGNLEASRELDGLARKLAWRSDSGSKNVSH